MYCTMLAIQDLSCCFYFDLQRGILTDMTVSSFSNLFNFCSHLHRNWSWGNIQHKPKTSAFTDSLHGIEGKMK